MNPLDALAEPPHDTISEQALLALMQSNPSPTIDICSNCLHDSDFYKPIHATIFQILKEQHAAGKSVDDVSLMPLMLRERIDVGEAYSLLINKPPHNTFGDFLRNVQNAACLRRIYISCHNTLKSISDPFTAPFRAIGDLKSELELCERATSTEIGKSLGEMWHAMIERMQGLTEQLPPIPTGIRQIDSKGMPRKGQMVLIGALRHVGKTALARQIAINCGKQKLKTLCFFAESSYEDEAANTMAVMSGVRTSDFSGAQQITAGMVKSMKQVLDDKPTVRIDTEPNLSVDTISHRCRILKATKGLDVVFVDYLQFLNTKTQKGQTREQAISEDARALKVLARELDVVLYLLVQLNDEVQPHEIPELRHIRESKGPVNHADIIWLMSAPDGIDHDPTSESGIQRRQLWNRKWRGVGAFSIPFELKFKGSTQQFLNT